MLADSMYSHRGQFSSPGDESAAGGAPLCPDSHWPRPQLLGGDGWGQHGEELRLHTSSEGGAPSTPTPPGPPSPGVCAENPVWRGSSRTTPETEFWATNRQGIEWNEISLVPLCVHLWGVLGVPCMRWGVLRGREEALKTLLEKHPVRFLPHGMRQQK